MDNMIFFMNSMSAILYGPHTKVDLVLDRFTSISDRSWCLGIIALG
jgi:hypothetical protein